MPSGRGGTGILGRKCSVPVGPAAGPHTQLVQNIIVSCLWGARFIELKTVQKLDVLKIEKPCIDVRDEGYNTEWSTELTVEGAFDEYLKAYVIRHSSSPCSGNIQISLQTCSST